MKDDKIKFPLTIFPSMIRGIIEITASELNFSIDYLASAIIFAFSIAIGNTRTLVVQAAWREKAILFMALLGSPGSMKTPVLNYVLSAFLKLDAQTIGEYQAKLKEWRKQDPEQRGEKPQEKQFRVQDITMEGLTKILEKIHRGIFVYVDELKGWISSFNRYRSSGGDMEQWLSIWSNQCITVNRKTQDDIIFIKDPFVGVVGGLQPGILPRLFGGNMMDNGFFYRILFVNNPDEGKPLLWKTEDMPSNADEELRNLIYKVLDAQGFFSGEEKNEEYHFSESAWNIIVNWQNEHENQIANEEPECNIVIFRKIQTYCLRFCLIIHAMREAVGEIDPNCVIDEKTAASATVLTDYFYETSKMAYDLIATGDVDNKKLFTLLNNLNDTFTTEQALAVGNKMGLSRATVFRLLSVGPNDPFLRKMRHGKYEKK